VAAHAVDEDQARRCIDLTLEKFGSINVLVDNAGTNPAFGPVIEQDHGRFAKTFDVNLWLGNAVPYRPGVHAGD
jgi:NAD(P)-dependent dehydrogenase (short-subunit alcohol dehydrogenase family)